MRHFITSASIGTVVGIAKEKRAQVKTTMTKDGIIVKPVDQYSSEIVRETLEVNGFGWAWLLDH